LSLAPHCRCEYCWLRGSGANLGSS
jgi:hypothetical protein